MSDLRSEMKNAYVYGGLTYREIAERFGVKERRVGEYARADSWRELKKQRRAEPPASGRGGCGGGEQRAESAVSDCGGQGQAPHCLNDEIAALALTVVRLGAKAAADDRQFMRYIVSEKSGRGETETVERVFKKLDTKAFRELTAAIKDLWAISQTPGESEKCSVTVELGAAQELGE